MITTRSRLFFKSRLIASIQIILQGLTPLALSITPAFSYSAASGNSGLSVSHISASQRAIIEADYISRNHFVTGHTMAAGEQLDAIAKSNYISLATLRELNRIKYPNDNDFYQIKTGDFLMVPQWASPEEAAAIMANCYSMRNINGYLLPHKTTALAASQGVNQPETLTEQVNPQPAASDYPAEWRNDDNGRTGLVSPLASQNDAEDRQVAGWLAQSGNLVQNGHAAEAAKNIAIGSASQAASSSMENWLNQFGHARIQMNVNDRLHLDGSSADLLLPLNDTGSLLTFTQLGIHDKDSYTTANLGLGQRWFSADEMWGYNAFIDQELRNNHTRLGLGAEYWRDYFKLAGNGYFGLTGWKASKTLADYEEKAASGFDIRSEGYLPTLPQLGAKLSYEQYFGKDVGLFGKEMRQQDPFAVTVGINYTPIPLITAGVDYKQGKGSANDTLLNLQFNYLFGVPWQDQISPEQVDALRTLNGSRLEFVNRNNNMVMQYRKMEVIKLSLPASLSGNAGSQQTITATVKAKHGLARIQWNDAALIAAGGSIKPLSSNQYQIMLPANVGNFPLSAIAYDTKGNASNTASTLVTVTSDSNAAKVSISSLAPDISSAPADNSTPVTYTLKAVLTTRDAGINLSDYKVQWSNNGAGNLNAQETALDANGQAQVKLTSGIAGNVNLTATLVDASGNQVDQKTDNSAKFIGDYEAVIKADKPTAVANGNDAITLSTTATNNGAPLEGYEVKWTITNPNGTKKEVTTQTDSKGETSTQVTSDSAGSVDIVAELKDNSGVTVAKDTMQVNFTPPSQTVDSITVSGTKSQYQWSDRNAELTVVVKDPNGAPVPGEKVSWDISGCGDCTAPAETTTDEKGNIAAKLALSNGATEGERTITVCSTSDKTKCADTTITFLAPPDIKQYRTLGTNVEKTSKSFDNVRIKGGQIEITATGTTNSIISYDWQSNAPSQIALSGTDRLQRTITLNDNVGGDITITAKGDNLEDRTATFTIVNNPTQWYYLPNPEIDALAYPNIYLLCPGATAVDNENELKNIYNIWGEFSKYSDATLTRRDGFNNLPVWIDKSAHGQDNKLATIFYFVGEFAGQSKNDISSGAAAAAWAVCK